MHIKVEAVETVSVEAPWRSRARSEQPTALWNGSSIRLKGDGRMTKCKTDMCTAHPERRVVNNGECRLCRDQSQMRDRWKKIREALRIAARYRAKSASDASTIAAAEEQLIVTLAIKVMPFRSTHSHSSSVLITKNKAVHQLRPSNDRSKPLSVRP